MFLFKKVVIDNFRSIGHIELDLYNQGLTLIEGINDTNQTYLSNGAGKSSLLDSITWALFDRTAEGIKADEVVNATVGKNTSVVLHFEVDDTPYRVERYRKHSKHKNKVFLYQGDNNLSLNSNASTNKEILDLFGIDINTYLNSIMYGQGDVEIFAKATDKGKKEILDNIANISLYKDAQKVAKRKASEFELLVTRKTSQITETNMRRDSLIALERQEEAKYKDTEALITQQKGELATLEEQIIKVSAETLTYKSGIQQEINQLSLELDTIEPNANPQELLEEFNSFKTKVTELKHIKQTLDNSLHQVELKEQSLSNDTNCYVCGALLDTEHREQERLKLNSERAELISKITPAKEALPALEGMLADKKRLVDEVYQANEHLNKQREQVQQSINNANQRLNLKDNELQQMNNTVTLKRTQIQQLESLPKPEGKKAELAKVEEDAKNLEKELLELNNQINEYNILSKDVFANTGVMSHVLDLTTPFLNEKANEYLSILSGSDIQIEMDTQTTNKDSTVSDKFSLTVFNGSGGSEYKANSAGERRRIDLSIALAIQDLVFSKSNLATNLVVYDECFDGLDSVGCENVIDILKKKQATVGTIYVITHNENLKPLFDNVLTIKKVNGFSELVTRED